MDGRGAYILSPFLADLLCLGRGIPDFFLRGLVTTAVGGGRVYTSGLYVLYTCHISLSWFCKHTNTHVNDSLQTHKHTPTNHNNKKKLQT